MAKKSKVIPAAEDLPAGVIPHESETPAELGAVLTGFRRYRCTLDSTGFANETGIYPVVNGFVDLPLDHNFYVYVGTYLFEE